MKFIFKYLKSYFVVVLLIVGLTYAQVQTELALPDYMSDIVTNGIQYSGVTSLVPELITEEDMNNVLRFSNVDEKILKHYELESIGQKAILGKQEIEFKDNTYVLKDSDEELIELMKMPMVYDYMASKTNLLINEDNIEEVKIELDKSIEAVKDNLESVIKLYECDIYTRVGGSIQTIQTNYIMHTGMVMLLISFVSVLVQIASTYLATNTAAKIAKKMRSDVFAKVESFSNSEFSKFSTASLITRTGNDITKAQQLIQMMLRMMLMSPIMGITAVFKVMRYPSISWLLLVAIGIIVGTMVFLLIFAVPKFEIIQKMTDKINAVMREFLDGLLVIRAFNSEEKEEKKFDEVNDGLRKLELFINKCMNVVGPIMTIVMNLLTVMIIWFSSKQIDMDIITIGDMMAFVQYAMHVVMSFMFVSVMFFMIPRSLVSIRRIEEVLNTTNTIVDIDNPKVLPKENGKLEFDNVSFKYPGADEYVLRNISFVAEPSETVAFIGSTGSGKSTIIKLIPRLFDVSEGSIRYCDIDIRDVKQSELHEHIGYATQKAILFSGTIKSNVVFGRDMSNEELKDAIKISQSQNIVDEKQDGIDALITQGGTNVSGGQKQRISIARALGKKASIYIFDDSFSALDYETDKKLRKELNKLIEETKATVFIVAQRISTIRNADKIIVLEEGKVVGIGKHNELMKNCKVYQEIAKSQLSTEELEYAA